ncbi:MAG TPA: GNAT family N-acetyltransferase [Candidatus Acidoferrales bacterium]|jgi:GNAT superfamily N-acetyltransferase|nr:GNAT family N-acetyltransferase [Candidatus Acidoferrales bacterium]
MTIIERASSGDFEHICALDETVHAGAPRRRLIGEACAQGRIAVARVDDVIRGYVIFDESFFDQFYVRLLLVHPDFRRRGLATALMRAAELDCQTGKLFTSTNQSNLPMQQLCARLGFIKSGYVENLDVADPELIYVKLLTPVPGTPRRDRED